MKEAAPRMEGDKTEMLKNLLLEVSSKISVSSKNGVTTFRMGEKPVDPDTYQIVLELDEATGDITISEPGTVMVIKTTQSPDEAAQFVKELAQRTETTL